MFLWEQQAGITDTHGTHVSGLSALLVGIFRSLIHFPRVVFPSWTFSSYFTPAAHRQDVLLVTVREVQTTWFNSWYCMIQSSKCTPSLNRLIYYSFWERSREETSMCVREGVVICGLILLVWRCVRPSYNWLPPHYFQQMVLSFSCHFKMETTALLRTFVLSLSLSLSFTLSVQPPTFLSGRQAPQSSLFFWVPFMPFFFSFTFVVSASKHSEKHADGRNVDFSIPLLAAKPESKEKRFDRRGIKRWHDSDWTHVLETDASLWKLNYD